VRYAIGVLLALVLVTGPAITQDEELHPRILVELNSKPVDCPPDLPGAEICGDFHAGFSTFKFELEFELGMGDYRAEPVTSWKLMRGIYARTYRVGEEVVSIGFDRKRHLIILKRGTLPEVEDEESDASGESAGDDDDDDDDVGVDEK